MTTSNKILVVDDNIINLEVISHVLVEEGFQIALAIDGTTALELVQKENFQLIILDIMMPDIDGYEVCSRIRRELHINNIPIIFLTAKAEREDVIKGFEIGGQDFITKPFDRKELLARINTQIELYHSREQLRNMNNTLEKKVQERTRALAESNKELNNANDKLMLLDNAKMEFLKIISHELRTPLNGIRGFAELIKKKNETEKLNTFISMLIDSIERLEGFSKIALDITSLKLNKYKINHEPVKINTCIEEAFTKNKSEVTEKNIKVNLNSIDNDISINGDPHLLAKAVAVLIENAIKHTKHNSTIHITSAYTSGYINCSIRDEGSGFNKKVIDRGIDLFSTGEQHLDMNMGLNLPFANLIFLAHNCFLKISNHEQGGGIVLIKIPIASDYSI